MNNRQKGLKNLLYMAMGQAVSIAFGMMLPRLFIVSDGSEVNGLLSSLTQLLAYLNLFEAGIGAATLQALYKPLPFWIVCGAVIYPSEYFCPQSFKTVILTLTENTYSIHYYDGSWLTKAERQRILQSCRIYQTYGALVPTVWMANHVKRKVKERGFFGTVQLAISRFFQRKESA